VPFLKATPFGRCKPDAIVFTVRLPSLSMVMAYTLPTRRVPTKIVPLSPSASERAFAMPEA
jgi:hypothetical protein